MFLLIKNVLIVKFNIVEEIFEFVDKYVICSKENVDLYFINY